MDASRLVLDLGAEWIANRKRNQQFSRLLMITILAKS